MFANTFQSGFISIFYSVGSSPLLLWDKQVKNGHIRRVVDDEVRSLVLEISGSNVATTYITCPIKPRLSLGIKLPFLVMIIKNMKKYFTFEIQILDDKDMHRRFRVSNFQSTTKVHPFCTTMPIGLSSGWNQVQFNLADFTKRAYGSTYIETTRVQIHANVRIRRIYFSDILYTDDELPNEYKLFVPTPGTQTVRQSRASVQQKKASVAAKDEKLPPEEIQVQMVEQEIPSGAPPSPAGVASPSLDQGQLPQSEAPSEGEASPTEGEPPSEAATDVSEVVQALTDEEGATSEPTTEAITEPTSEAPSEPATETPAEPEVFEDAVTDQPAGEAPKEEAAPAPAEGEKRQTEAPPAEAEAAPVEAEAPPAVEAPPGEEAPPTDEAASPAEAPPAEAPPAEEVPAEAPPAEAPAAEAPPAEAPPAEAPPAEVPTAEEPPAEAPPAEAPPAEEQAEAKAEA